MYDLLLAGREVVAPGLVGVFDVDEIRRRAGLFEGRGDDERHGLAVVADRRAPVSTGYAREYGEGTAGSALPCAGALRWVITMRTPGDCFGARRVDRGNAPACRSSRRR